jgi:hypothetical protein
MEREFNGLISFLDVSIMRDSIGKISTKVYRKATWSGLYLNYNSFVPMKYKIGLLRTLSFRASKICSPECLAEEMAFLRTTLLRNNFPPIFIDKHLRLPSKPNFIYEGPEKKQLFIKLPFLGDIHNQLISKRMSADFEIRSQLLE